MLTEAQKKSFAKLKSSCQDIPKIDKTGLVTGYCSVPWNSLMIIESGEMFNCHCQGYVTPQSSIGNILKLESIDQFKSWFDNSEVKQGILDLSYKACNADICPSLINNINKGLNVFLKNKEQLNWIRSRTYCMSRNVHFICSRNSANG